MAEESNLAKQLEEKNKFTEDERYENIEFVSNGIYQFSSVQFSKYISGNKAKYMMLSFRGPRSRTVK